MTIHSHRSYLDKHRFLPRQIRLDPPPKLGLEVVIPCHNEPGLIQTLTSLISCDLPTSQVETIVVINSGEKADEAVKNQNRLTLMEAERWIQQVSPPFPIHLIQVEDLPKKHAGVGLARKIGMDEAVDRFNQAEENNGIIVCLDADCVVDANYLTEVENHFLRNPKTEACSIYFEHPLEGDVFEPIVYAGIVQYELYLRYYIEGLRYAGHPFAFHTVGSSMAVKSDAYQRQGGMNRRKAGEDFYFLQKFIENEKLSELHTTRVIPSPRPAENVPFGTGKAISTWIRESQDNYPAFAPEVFQDLRVFIDQIPTLYQNPPESLPQPIKSFLEKEQFDERLIEIRSHVSSQQAFIKRFFRWFDGLKVLQYAHYARDHYYPDIPVAAAALHLLGLIDSSRQQNHETPHSLLKYYRKWQRKS